MKLAFILAVTVKSAELTNEAMIGLNTQVKRKHILDVKRNDSVERGVAGCQQESQE